MKKHSLRLGLSLLPLVLCACTQDWSGGLESARLNKGGTEMSAAVAQTSSADAMSVSQRRRDSAFANHPDTGSLVHYAAKIAPRRTGAYTWHAADLSEEHAFRAMASGELTFQAPDGTPIKLAYQRHIEHPDGNWSWIGEAADGQTSVITFGEEAVFGTIPQGNGQPPLRLTLADGRAWVVSADKRLLAEIDNEATRPTSPDYLIPPKRVQAAGAASDGMAAMAAPVTAGASSSATTVIDVLVGYTNGFASARGSQSAAQTRIRNLVDITNQAYVSSQINAELRLVHSMQVSFPDNTANEDALEKLTGFRAPSTQLTPDPAFKDLRQARETYGADLVALVRKFNDPENDGCGIAWLLGGGQSGISPSDEYFGYSVISDGQDAGNDGKTYFCREETFAHEIGHNLGSQHDAETAENEPGAYAYSYGYKTGSTQGNFYTIMAYGDSGQTGYRVFSNPNITSCGGRACGTATADNARSINNTKGIIAGFRATVVTDPDEPVGPSVFVDRADFDGDGVEDLYWTNIKTGQGVIWRSGNSSQLQLTTVVQDLNWKVSAIADFNGDGKSDILWRNGVTGANVIWRSANSATPQSMRSVTGDGWGMAGVGDFNGDGKADVLWNNSKTGKNVIWRSAAGSSLQAVAEIQDLNWKPAAVGDFDGDGKADIFWRNQSNGANVIWRSANKATPISMATVSNPGWGVGAAGDFDGDGKTDVLWNNQLDGSNVIWRSASSALPRAVSPIKNLSWRPGVRGDYNGDGKSDMLWRNKDTGANAIWLSANSGSLKAVQPVTGDGWYLAGP
ncbi:FG-GAP-like repeat-containing protein [Marilutibacter maris]|uniref:FG-GAP-like repeat-containing protein n=1 Tax=Marilutibacter maris TaxID=1605891 RepID=UPI000DA720E6|nr:FG-GAP-like repeat-containing protein [Lysobacter maris]